jgi:hypothetical protein
MQINQSMDAYLVEVVLNLRADEQFVALLLLLPALQPFRDDAAAYICQSKNTN